MSEDIFVDKLVDISVTGTVVRLHFANIALSNNDGDGQATYSPSHRLIIPIEGFLQLSETVRQMLDVMIEKGTIVRRDEA